MSFPPTTQIGGEVTYTLTLSAGGVSKQTTVIEQVAPLLAVANFNTPPEVVLYPLSGITSSTQAEMSLSTGSKIPVALAFDPEGNLWVGGSTCSTSFLEEFKAPFSQNEQPISFTSLSLTGPIYSLAFDAQGNLWVGEESCSTSSFGQIQEYTSSSGPSPVGSPLNPPGAPYGLTLDQEGNLWVGVVTRSSTEIVEYLAPVSSHSTTQTYSLSTTSSAGFGPLAFDTSGNLYSFVQATTNAPLEELKAGSSPANPDFITFSNVTSTGTGGVVPIGLVFDSSGDLWISEGNGVKEFTPPLTSPMTPTTLTNEINGPADLAIWPIPQGLPLY